MLVNSSATLGLPAGSAGRRTATARDTTTIGGNEAAALGAYQASEVIAIYPRSGGRCGASFIARAAPIRSMIGLAEFVPDLGRPGHALDGRQTAASAELLGPGVTTAVEAIQQPGAPQRVARVADDAFWVNRLDILAARGVAILRSSERTVVLQGASRAGDDRR